MSDREFYDNLDRMSTDLLREMDDDLQDALAAGHFAEAEGLIEEGLVMADLLEAGRPRLRVTVH